MNDQTTEQIELVLRRLAEPVNIGGKEVDPRLWLAVLIPVLVAGLFYVIWMYFRDGRAVGWPWATFLASLRYLVYLILGGVFLLPALQAWETSEARSKVIVVIDVSGSMTSIDDLPTAGVTPEQLPTRLDKVVGFLTSERIAFLKRLQDTNPVAVYRFGGRLDEDYKLFEGGKVASAAEWNAWLQMDPREWVLDGLSPEAREICLASAEFTIAQGATTVNWASEWRALEEDRAIPRQIRDEERFQQDKAKLVDKQKKLEKRLDVRQQVLSGTNLGDSLLALVNREGNNMVQGIVVISDGRSNQGAEQAFQ